MKLNKNLRVVVKKFRILDPDIIELKKSFFIPAQDFSIKFEKFLIKRSVSIFVRNPIMKRQMKKN